MSKTKICSLRKNQLRQEARDKECQIRSPGCNWNPETTVLCHLNSGGMGTKTSDILAAWGCSGCNHYCDGGYTEHGHTKQDADFALYQGMARTIDQLEQRGYELGYRIE